MYTFSWGVSWNICLKILLGIFFLFCINLKKKKWKNEIFFFSDRKRVRFRNIVIFIHLKKYLANGILYRMKLWLKSCHIKDKIAILKVTFWDLNNLLVFCELILSKFWMISILIRKGFFCKRFEVRTYNIHRNLFVYFSIFLFSSFYFSFFFIFHLKIILLCATFLALYTYAFEFVSAPCIQ